MSTTVPLLFATKGPLRGPMVPVTKRYSKVTATGVDVGDVVLVHSVGEGHSLLLEITKNGTYDLPTLEGAKYLQAFRFGEESTDLSVYLEG